MNKKYFFILSVIIGTVILIAIAIWWNANFNHTLKTKCEAVNGRYYVAETGVIDCANVNESTCIAIGGKYLKCPSLCRYNINGICTKICGLDTCTFTPEK